MHRGGGWRRVHRGGGWRRVHRGGGWRRVHRGDGWRRAQWTLKVHGEPADRGPSAGVWWVLARNGDYHRGAVCSHPAALHDPEGARDGGLPGEAEEAHPRREGEAKTGSLSSGWNLYTHIIRSTVRRDSWSWKWMSSTPSRHCSWPHTMPVVSPQGVSFEDFKEFGQFLNNLDDMALAMKMYTYTDKPISQGDTPPWHTSSSSSAVIIIIIIIIIIIYSQ